MLATVAAISAVLCIGTSHFLGPLLTRRVPVLTVVAVGQAVPSLVLGIVIAVLGQPLPGLGFLVIALAIGLHGGIATAFGFRAGQIGHIGRVAVILSLCSIIPAVVGILGGERPPIHQWIGIAIAATGTGLTILTGNRERRRSDGVALDVPNVPGTPAAMAGAVLPAMEQPSIPVRTVRRFRDSWALLAITAAIGFGIYMTVLVDLSKENLLWAVALSRIGMAIAAAAAIPLVGQPFLAPGRWQPQIFPLPVLGSLMVTAMMLYAYAGGTMLTVASALTAFAPVIAATLSWVILREKLTPPQIFGIGIAVCGLVLIAV